MNQINLLGFMAYEPKVKMSKSQTPYVRFVVSVPKIGKKKQYNFFSCIIYGKSAEALATYIKKGNKICVTGSVDVGRYEKNGETVNSYTVQVRSFYGMSYNSEDDEQHEPTENDLDFLEEE